MPAVAERPEFTPPDEGGLLRSLSFAIVAHLLLVLALSLGVQWKREDNTLAVEAELWSPTVQQAAPKPVETPPPPPPPPVVEKPVVQPPPAPPVRSDADIALEREKERQEKAREEEAQRQRKLAAERKRQEELAAERKRQDDLARQEQAKKDQARKLAEDRKRDEQAKAKRQQDEQRLAKLHEENLRRIQGLAGATGSPGATGTALRSSGPSDSYAGRIRARVKPNIVFTDDVPGNPMAVVEVRLAPDGTIIGKRVSKSSGVKSWDDAVLRALDRTEVLPRDVDGRVHTPIELVFRPRD